MVAGETLANLVNPEQFVKILPIQIISYIIKLWVDSTTNEYQANSKEHAWLKLVTTKSTWTLFNHHYSLCQYLLDYPVLLYKEVMLRHWEHFKSNIFIFISSRVLSPHHT